MAGDLPVKLSSLYHKKPEPYQNLFANPQKTPSNDDQGSAKREKRRSIGLEVCQLIAGLRLTGMSLIGQIAPAGKAGNEEGIRLGRHLAFRALLKASTKESFASPDSSREETCLYLVPSNS